MKPLFKSFVIASITTITLGGILLAFSKAEARLARSQDGKVTDADQSDRYAIDELAHFHWMS